jgi:hypothetical protein
MLVAMKIPLKSIILKVKFNKHILLRILMIAIKLLCVRYRNLFGNGILSIVIYFLQWNVIITVH